jgi:CRISPR-associated exonuclease Cas4
MHNFANKYVRVSDLSSYMICPRIAFFRVRQDDAGHTAEGVRSEVLQEIAVSLYSIATAVNPAIAMEQVYDRACEDIAAVSGLTVEEVRAMADGYPENIIRGLQEESARLGRERLLKLLKQEETRISLRSDKLRLSGTVNRIASVDSRLMPAVVSSSQPPENGIYKSDRIRLAAYALLISERYGVEVEQGIIEYMGGWCIREAEIRRGDKREALSIRRRIEESGSSMPDARRGKWCEKCTYRSKCTARVSFLDSLFKQAYP